MTMPGFTAEVSLSRTTVLWKTEGAAPAMAGEARVVPVPIPHDCADGFLGAYWRRPTAYLDPEVRAAISALAKAQAHQGLARLAAELADGRWREKHGAVLGEGELDLGYRLLIAEPGPRLHR